MRELSAIMEALYAGDDERVRSLRAEQPELDVFEAAALGDVERLRALVDEDPALVGAWSADGFNPLHYAAFFDGAAAVTLLAERDADLEAPSRNREFAREARPLHSAVAAGRRETVAALLAAGADPNARRLEGFTPLMEAEQAGDLELAELLIRHGAIAGGGA